MQNGYQCWKLALAHLITRLEKYVWDADNGLLAVIGRYDFEPFDSESVQGAKTSVSVSYKYPSRVCSHPDDQTRDSLVSNHLPVKY